MTKHRGPGETGRTGNKANALSVGVPGGRSRGNAEEVGEREEGMEEAAAKRVKWDRGLQTTVFLEDTPPRPRWNVKAVPSSKGCLTPAAKVRVRVRS